MFFLQFCFRVMCFSFRVPLPPNFSNFSTQRCSERVLYSANTRALSGYAISGCINVPNNQLIPAHQPIHLARPFPTRTHHPIHSDSTPVPTTHPAHPAPPPPLGQPAQPGPTRPVTPSQPRPTLTRYPPKKSLAAPQRQDGPAHVWREGDVRVACSGTGAA